MMPICSLALAQDQTTQNSNPGGNPGRGFGLGVIIGEPTGLSMKDWLSYNTAIDAGVAWSFAGPGSFHLHADYLIHNFDVIHTEGTRIPLYYGIGGRFKAEDNGNARLGIRGVVGLDFFISNSPLDAFLEIAPVMDIAPTTVLTANGGFGFRFFFR